MNRKKILDTERRLIRREEALQSDTTKYLLDCGWEYTCDTPGAFWLWRRKYRGAYILVDSKVAMHMQAAVNSGVYDFD